MRTDDEDAWRPGGAASLRNEIGEALPPGLIFLAHGRIAGVTPGVLNQPGGLAQARVLPEVPLPDLLGQPLNIMMELCFKLV